MCGGYAAQKYLFTLLPNHCLTYAIKANGQPVGHPMTLAQVPISSYINILNSQLTSMKGG